MTIDSYLDDYLSYLRKSRQDNELEPVEEVLARHERQLQEYALKTFGHKIKEENIYREVVSGETIEDRPEINKMFKRLQEDKNIKGVLVIEPSRLTRGDLLDCGTVVHLFKYTNTKVITPTKTYDLDDKFDRKFFEMELTRGNDYLEYTKEILARGRHASVHEGNYIGSVAPYGYNRIKIGKSWSLTINEKEAEYVRLVYQLYVDGLGANAIAHKLNELGVIPRRTQQFSSQTIRNILDNPIYIGKLRWKHKPQSKVYEDGKLVKKRALNYDSELIDGKHPRIIDEELYQKSLKRKGLGSREKQDFALRNIYAGILKCKKCGRAMALKNYNGQAVSRVRDKRYACSSARYCTNISSNSSIVNKAIFKALQEHLKDFEVKIKDNDDSIVRTHENIIKTNEKELATLEIKQEELYDLLESGIYTKEVFVKRNEKLAIERERLKEAIKVAKETIPTIEDYREKYFSLKKAIEMIKDDSYGAKEKNNFLKEVIKIIYYEKDVPSLVDHEDDKNIKLEIVLK